VFDSSGTFDISILEVGQCGGSESHERRYHLGGDNIDLRIISGSFRSSRRTRMTFPKTGRRCSA
jgi:molecular chaperone DnaK (HSP70)